MKYLLVLSMLAILFDGCQSEQEEPSVDCDTYDLTITLVSTTDANCNNSDGMITVQASGGEGGYTYSLNGGNENSNGQFTAVAAGVYTVMVSDNSPCTASVSATVNTIDGVQFMDVELADAGCGTEQGTIVVSAINGTPPYMYALNGGSFQSDSVFSGLAAGEYTVNLIDDNSCETSQNVQILHGISWELEVQQIIEGNCALPNCHGGTQPPDFSDFQNVVNNAENIKTRTGNGTMPPNAVLDDDDIQRIACWVDDGALDN